MGLAFYLSSLSGVCAGRAHFVLTLRVYPTMHGEPIRMLEVTRTDDSTAAVHTKIIELLTARGQSRERYAALRNRSRTQAADALIAANPRANGRA